MNITKPKVSIVIPVYNVEKYLRQCLDSVVNQTLKEVEIICVNDGSTDSSLDILKEYAEKDQRIKIIDKTNSGYGHSMNVGMDAATGEYLGIVESDDFASLDMFEALYKVAKEHNVDVVKSNYYALYQIDSIPKKLFKEILPPKYYKKIICPIDTPEIFRVMPSIWSAIYRLEMLKSNNIRFMETPGASFQDTAFNFKVWACANSAYLLKNAYLHYRMDNVSSSVRSPSKVFCVCDEYRAIEIFLKEHPSKKEKLEKLKNALKYETYRWNLQRLAPEYKYAFLIQMAREFKDAEREGKLDKELFSYQDWENLSLIIRDPDCYYLQKYKPSDVNPISQSQYEDLKRELESVYNSVSFRIGRMITAIPRKIRDSLKN